MSRCFILFWLKTIATIGVPQITAVLLIKSIPDNTAAIRATQVMVQKADELERRETNVKHQWPDDLERRTRNSLEFFNAARFKKFKMLPIRAAEKNDAEIRKKVSWFVRTLRREKAAAKEQAGTERDPFRDKVPAEFADITGTKDLILMARMENICRERGLKPPKSIINLFLEGIKCVGECDVDELWPDKDAEDAASGVPKGNADRFTRASVSELSQEDSNEIWKQRIQEVEVEPLLKFARCSGPTEVFDPVNEGSCL
jgi:hypothetical protein